MTPDHETTNHEATAPRRRLGELAALRFPLLPRRKPACPPLIDRIGRVRHRANPAQGRPDESLVRAAEAHNLAALILSDCAIPEPARALCWRQFDLFATAGPYRQNTAKLALQPLINLGRLHTRDGDGHAAYQLHHAMFQAAKTRTTATIDNRPVDLAAVVAPGDDHAAIVGWLWTILLADGLRALCRAGRWPEAHAQAEHHHGIGERPLDGRQIAIIAHSTAGDHDQALRLIDATAAPAGWEQAIVACLAVFCRTWAGLPTPAASEAMVRTYLGLEPDPEHTLFHIRLGLTAASLATDSSDIRAITETIERLAVESGDAYAAHDILTPGGHLPITEHTAHVLHDTVTGAGLGTPIAAHLLEDLMRAVHASEQRLMHALGRDDHRRTGRAHTAGTR